MVFLLLVGAAPNAIAYASGRFTPKEFLKAGTPASILLLAVLAAFVCVIWPVMGMPVLVSWCPESEIRRHSSAATSIGAALLLLDGPLLCLVVAPCPSGVSSLSVRQRISDSGHWDSPLQEGS